MKIIRKCCYLKENPKVIEGWIIDIFRTIERLTYKSDKTYLERNLEKATKIKSTVIVKHFDFKYRYRYRSRIKTSRKLKKKNFEKILILGGTGLSVS